MGSAPVERNVEALLLNERICRRRPGDIPYPLDFTNDLLTYDIWNNMFLLKSWERLTLHPFTTPPAVVLDLCCGGGYWSIEAAKQWPESSIVGFDLKEIQPRLHTMETQKSIASRVKWVHGNLLDGLPFAPDHFDFVRIVGIGLGVPEDEWQYVFEEVYRVMKPGGAFEIIEEDLIFPCGNPPVHKRPPTLNLSVDLPRIDSPPSSTQSVRSSSTWFSDPFHFGNEDYSDLTVRRKSNTLPSLDTTSSLSPRSPSTPHSHKYPTISPIDRNSNLLDGVEDGELDPDPQDHSRLKASWEALLSNRFISPKVLTVLPFYLSSCFTDVTPMPLMHVPLPQNSKLPSESESSLGNRTNRNSNDSLPLSMNAPSSSESLMPSRTRAQSENHIHMRTGKIRNRKFIKPPSFMQPAAMTNAWAASHLAKAVSTIMACKEAIWTEYRKLYGSEKKPKHIKTIRPEQGHLHVIQPSSREDFERDWSNWENDMMDRMRVRDGVITELLWKEPPGERPDWLVWRNNLDTIRKSQGEQSPILTPTPPPEICRSLRGFLAWKPR